MMLRHALPGQVDWIGLRSERRADIAVVEQAQVLNAGLVGDHGRPGKRAVTLIQAEYLPVIASLLGRDTVDPADLRRNLVVSGVNLAAFRKLPIQIGAVILQIEGPCPPCSRMEETFGHGGYNAVRGHGGWYASVVVDGTIKKGDACLFGQTSPV